MHAGHLLAANEILLILQPPPPPSIHTQYWLGQQNASVDLWEKDSPCEHEILFSCWFDVDHSFRNVTGKIVRGYLKSIGKKEQGERKGGRERSLLMQRIHFVFPQTADTYF